MKKFAAALLCLIAGNSAAMEIVVYPAFGTGTKALIEGRVIESEKRSEPARDDSRSTNLRRNLDMLSNDEMADVVVTVQINQQSWQATTDAEGYFQVAISGLEAADAGWHPIAARAATVSGTGALLLVPPGNIHGLISDFDDTVVVSEVNDKRRLLENSLLKNFMQREAVAGAADLYARLAGKNPDVAAAPLFYLSASPRQLHSSIQAFLDRNRFPRGVLITKKVTNDSTSEPLHDQIAYKTAKLADLFERLPHVTFTLMGDDGESDPEIYQAVKQRYPARVSAIWIRRVNPDPKRKKLEGQGDLQTLLTLAR